MPNSLDLFLKELMALCERHERGYLIAPLTAFAVAAFPQVLRLEEERIAHRSHPLRVLNHLFVALREMPAAPPLFVLALAVVSLGHDLAAVKKITTTAAAAQGPGPEVEERRKILRLLHEAEGTVELIRAALAASAILSDGGHTPFDSRTIEFAARVSAVHDTPSLRSPLPICEGELGEALAVFVMADGLCMIEHDRGAGEAPLGPRVEPWARGGHWARGDGAARDAVARQAVDSVKSLRSRLQSAFRLPAGTALPGCFSNTALRDLAREYISLWGADLALDLRDAAGIA